MIHVLGGGLAGCEAAWQAASRGQPVVIHEMRPVRQTEVHRTDDLAELVCSNSLRSDKLDNAVGLLKEEMRRLGSLVMRVADAVRVPAGAALAVDRERFAEKMTARGRRPSAHHRRARGGDGRARPRVGGRRRSIVATGPLTSPALSASIAALVGHRHLYFYDAVSPIVLAETIDRSRVFRASRWGRSLHRGEPAWPAVEGVAPGAAADGRATTSTARSRATEYETFYEALVTRGAGRRCTTSRRRRSSRGACRSR